MNNEEPSYKKRRILLLIFIILVIFASIKPSYLNDKTQKSLKSCSDTGCVSRLQPTVSITQNLQGDLEDHKKTIFDLYIIGLLNIDELAMWVLGVDRRVIVIKTMHKYGLIKASDIAEKTGRSLQNISHGLRELEERGLIKCITPEKQTWKRYVLTEKGTEVFETLRNFVSP